MPNKDGALDALFKKPAFASLGEERIALFRRFAEEIEGKSPMEVAAKYVRLNMRLSKEQPLTDAERKAVSAAIKESLSEEDRRKYAGVLKML